MSDPRWSAEGGRPSPMRRSLVPLGIGLLIGALAVVAVLAVTGQLGPSAPPGPALPTGVAVASPPVVSPSASLHGTPPQTPAQSFTPTATPSPTPGPPVTADPSTGELPIDPLIEAEIRAVIEDVPELRDLEPRAEVPFRIISQDQFEREFRAQFLAENPASRIAAEEALLVRLGMLDPAADLEELVLSLYGSQVAAFYDPRSGAFTVIARAGFEFGPDDQIVVAHEYAHALQDQHFDLEATQVIDPNEGDRALAQLALIEGDATILMLEWAQANLSFEQLLGLAGSINPADQALLESMPPVLRRQLEFPYLDGLVFAMSLRGGGGWEGVDAAFADRPSSTEQILHPEKYVAREAPLVAQMPEIAGSLGDGWSESYRQAMGELLTGVWVADGAEAPSGGLPGLPAPLPNAAAAQGWGGDRIVSLDGPGGAWAVAWLTLWDSEADSSEFAVAAETAMADLSGAHVIQDVGAPGSGPQRLVLIASDAGTLDALSAATRDR